MHVELFTQARRGRPRFLEAATFSDVEVPGVHVVPAATLMVVLHSPPATHIWKEVPSEEHLYSPTVHDPELELDDELEEDELEPLPVAAAAGLVAAWVVASAAALVVAATTEVRKPEGLPVAAAAEVVATTAALVVALPLDESLPLPSLLLLLLVPSYVTPLAKQLSPVMSS